MNLRLSILALAGLVVLGACADQNPAPTAPSTAATPDSPALAAGGVGPTAINVVLKARPTAAQLAQLGAIGAVERQYPEINGLTLQARADQLAAIRALPFVKGAAVDQEIMIPPPTDLVPVTDFTGGISTWDQDAIDVTVRPLSSERDVAETGDGVYVGVLDTGLLYTWRQYFPEERIATQYARTFTGGGAADRGKVVELPGDQWQHDVCAHGTHVTSTILGYNLGGTYFQGTAPRATVIPVRLNAEGSANTPRSCSFYSSVAAAGLLYFAELKQGPLAGRPLVVNNSWGSGSPDPLVQAAVDYALAHGVLLVFSAGNAGEAGMGYPGAYAPVISAAASGWTQEWTTPTWWFALDVPEPTPPDQFYITDFSSRAKAGQDLDVAAPGSWVVGPFQLQRGQPSYFFLGGTSMAAPHVTGTVALMLEKDPSLTQAQAETTLEQTAIALGAGCRMVRPAPGAEPTQICWGTDATGAGLLDADAAVAATS
ncbi:MAG TPA: S8 family serine peptidase [Gemmatimonadales bacterium]|nr:S8 family serine peptidase [Gemmatimonadales bacterium]